MEPIPPRPYIAFPSRASSPVSEYLLGGLPLGRPLPGCPSTGGSLWLGPASGPYTSTVSHARPFPFAGDGGSGCGLSPPSARPISLSRGDERSGHCMFGVSTALTGLLNCDEYGEKYRPGNPPFSVAALMGESSHPPLSGLWLSGVSPDGGARAPTWPAHPLCSLGFSIWRRYARRRRLPRQTMAKPASTSTKPREPRATPTLAPRPKEPSSK